MFIKSSLLFAILASASAETVLYTLNRNNVDLESLPCHVDVNHVSGTDQVQIVGQESDLAELESYGFELVSSVVSTPFRKLNDGYDDPETLWEKFNALAANHADFAKVFDLTDTYNTAPTHQGRHIFAMKISDNVHADEDEPNVLVVSNHHSRELVTPQLALDTAERLLSDEDLTDIVQNNQVYVMWTMNPDGLEYTWEVDNMWRKNMNQNWDGTLGVDLNRNYPIGWDYSCAGSTTPSSQTYRGPSALSEPETQTMVAFQADRHFAKVLDFHSYAREVRINYGSCATLPPSVDDLFKDIATDMADLAQYKQARSCCMGGDVHNAYNRHGALAFLVETATAFQPPVDQMRAELERVWPSTLHFLRLPAPISGHVRDGETKELVEATFEIDGVNFTEDERVATDKNGRFHLWLPAGEYDVLVTTHTNPAGSDVFTLKASESGEYYEIEV
eukprot:Rmarinus@m.20452